MSILSTGLAPKSQDGRDARYSFSCPDCVWQTDSEPQLRCHRISAHGLRFAIVWDKSDCSHCHRRFSSISSARHHVRHQSCQRNGACTARAVHHELAQTKDLHLPPSLGLVPPLIAFPPTEFVCTPVNHVDFRFHGNNQEAQDGGPGRSRHHSGELWHLQSDVQTPQSRRDCLTPRLRDQIAYGLVQSFLVVQPGRGAGPSAPQGSAELQREQTFQGTASLGTSSPKWMVP